MFDNNFGGRKAQKYLVSIASKKEVKRPGRNTLVDDWEVDSYVTCEVHAHLTPLTGSSMVPVDDAGTPCQMCKHLASQQASSQLIKHRAGTADN